MEDKEKIKILGETLYTAAQHLEYCGYGDGWERSCAESSGLRDKIEKALELFGKEVLP